MATRSKSESSTETQTDSTPEAAPQDAPEQPKMQVKPPPQESKIHVVEWQGQPQRTDATPAETGEAQEQTTESDGKSFTQSDLDAIVANRLKREKAEQDRLAKELEKASKELQNYKDAEKTEAEKIAERLARVEAENQSLVERNRQMAIDQELAAAASKIQLPIDAALKLAERNAIEIDDDGRVTNAAELIKAVAEAYPGLVARQTSVPTPAVNSSRSEQSGKPSDAELRKRYFGSGGGNFWQSGGVLMPADEE